MAVDGRGLHIPAQAQDGQELAVLRLGTKPPVGPVPSGPFRSSSGLPSEVIRKHPVALLLWQAALVHLGTRSQSHTLRPALPKRPPRGLLLEGDDRIQEVLGQVGPHFDQPHRKGGERKKHRALRFGPNSPIAAFAALARCSPGSTCGAPRYPRPLASPSSCRSDLPSPVVLSHKHGSILPRRGVLLAAACFVLDPLLLTVLDNPWR